MVVGIDETGDFAPGSALLSFFVAVKLTQHHDGLRTKEKQFREWLAGIPRHKLTPNGEVKGSDLTDDELVAFAQSVICAEPAVRISYVQFRPSENPEELMKDFKAQEAAALEHASEQARQDGKTKMAEQYANMAIWHKNAKKMHYQHFIKLIMLRNLITLCFRQVVGVSILLERLGEDAAHANLLNIEFKIDRDFVRGREPELYWKELLRTAFINSSDGVPLLDEWQQTGHPFLTKYRQAEGPGLDFAEVFKNHCSFYDSHDAFEVQMADITAIIINRFRNRGAAERPYRELWQVFPKSNKPIQLMLNPAARQLP
jgi:hypothetical protein